MKGKSCKILISIFSLLVPLCLTITSCAPKQSPEDELDNTGQALSDQGSDNESDSEEIGRAKRRNRLESGGPEGDFEQFPTFNAQDILKSGLLSSEYHQVARDVKGDCVWNSYTIDSEFGEYEAYNSRILEIRVREIQATAELRKISGAGAVATGAVDSVIVPFRSAINVATKPVETVIGVPGGVVTFFKKIYYSGEKAVIIAGRTVQYTGRDQVGEDGYTYPHLTGEAAYLVDWYLGISGGERRLAKKLGVDPYTSNPKLAAELKRVAKYDRIERIGLGFAPIPSVPGMGYVKDVNHYVWDKDPRELRDYIKKSLLEMGIDGELVERFLDSPYYSPSFQTTIVFSLSGMDNVGNREEVIEDAIVAGSIPEAEFFTNLVVLLLWFHENETPMKSIINHGDITSGLTEDDRIITIFPVDYLCWSAYVAEAAEFHDEVFKNIEARGRELWIAGTVSPRAKDELNNLGWEVFDNVSVEDAGMT